MRVEEVLLWCVGMCARRCAAPGFGCEPDDVRVSVPCVVPLCLLLIILDLFKWSDRS